MPLARRRIGGALEYGHPHLYDTTKSATRQTILQDVCEASMTGTLVQIGLLSHYASEMFEGLFAETKAVQARVFKAKARAAALAKELPAVEARVAALTETQIMRLATADKKDKFHSSVDTAGPAGGYFTKASMSAAARERYDSSEVERCPDFSKIDAVLKRETGCLKSYSNPGFFLDQWAAKELEQLQVLKKEKDQRKKDRRERKKRERERAEAAAKQDTERREALDDQKGMLNWRARYGLDDDVSRARIFLRRVAAAPRPGCG